MKTVILFDLGQTLAAYFERAEFPGILAEAIAEVTGYLREEGLLHLSPEEIWPRVMDENHESPDYRVRPLEERLARIFQLEQDQRARPMPALCQRFLKPIFARGRCYEDTLPTLRELRSRGFKIGIVSNSPWGSSADPWREEIARLGLTPYVDTIVLCGEVGWRKPDRRIFDLALARLHALPEQCLFVGDDPRWDLAGPRALGMEALLIDRQGTQQNTPEQPIRDLHELLRRTMIRELRE